MKIIEERVITEQRNNDNLKHINGKLKEELKTFHEKLLKKKSKKMNLKKKLKEAEDKISQVKPFKAKQHMEMNKLSVTLNNFNHTFHSQTVKQQKLNTLGEISSLLGKYRQNI
jgi:seryl-tRNA synthetase